MPGQVYIGSQLVTIQLVLIIPLWDKIQEWADKHLFLLVQVQDNAVLDMESNRLSQQDMIM